MSKKVLTVFLSVFLFATSSIFAQLNGQLSPLQKANFDVSKTVENTKNYSSTKEVRKFNAKGKKISFPLKVTIMVATFATSMATAYLGFSNNSLSNDVYDKYRYSRDPDEIEKYKQQVDDYESKRNMYYTISGVSGAGFIASIFVF